MKSHFFLSIIFVLFSFNLVSYASIQNNAQLDILPLKAKSLIETYFSDTEFVRVQQTAKTSSFRLLSAEGWVVIFSKEGSWTDIDCKTERIPSPLIPSEILNNIAKCFGTAVKVVKISLTSKGKYIVKLSNYIQLAYDREYHRINYK